MDSRHRRNRVRGRAAAGHPGDTPTRTRALSRSMVSHAPAAAVLLEGEPVTSLAEYRRRGGPAQVIDVIRQAGLRGRGGAGFPTAIKWDNLRRTDAVAKYVVCNGAEGEPGTFKDRLLLMHNPYQAL